MNNKKFYIHPEDVLKFKKTGYSYWKPPDICIGYNKTYPDVFSITGNKLFLTGKIFLNNAGEILVELTTDPHIKNTEFWYYNSCENTIYNENEIQKKYLKMNYYSEFLFDMINNKVNNELHKKALSFISRDHNIDFNILNETQEFDISGTYILDDNCDAWNPKKIKYERYI